MKYKNKPTLSVRSSDWLEESVKKETALTIRKIGLALNSCNGCMASDDHGVNWWTIDHSEEIKGLRSICDLIGIISSDIYLEYEDHNTGPLMGRPKDP